MPTPQAVGDSESRDETRDAAHAQSDQRLLVDSRQWWGTPAAHPASCELRNDDIQLGEWRKIDRVESVDSEHITGFHRRDDLEVENLASRDGLTLHQARQNIYALRGCGQNTEKADKT